jgi:hypothetical protein
MNGIVMGLILIEDGAPEEITQLIEGPVEITISGEALLEASLETDQITVEIGDE